MPDTTALSTEDRVAIDRVYERTSGRTHYEVLALPADSPWETIDQTARDLRRRFDGNRFVGVPTEEYQRRIDHVLRALDQAVDVLSDPVRRFLYDQQIRRGEGRRAETLSPARPAATPLPPLPPRSTPPAREERPSRLPEAPPPSRPSEAPLVVPVPLRQDRITGDGGRAPHRPTGNRPSGFPGPAPQSTSAGSAADRRDLDALLVEVERIAVSVQFCLAQVIDPQSSRVASLQTAGQALADTRATIAAIQARRDEEAGRWPAASNNWQRAVRARPQDAALLGRLAECLQRTGDAVGADDAARRALAVDPNNEAARGVLAALNRR